MFQDLNDLIFIFYEHIYHSNTSLLSKHNVTKRVYLNTQQSVRKKTIRKQYKG